MQTIILKFGLIEFLKKDLAFASCLGPPSAFFLLPLKNQWWVHVSKIKLYISWLWPNILEVLWIMYLFSSRW